MAYMEYSSLDGNPSLWQKVMVWYLQNFKSLVVKETWSPAKIVPYTLKLLNFVLTVGLSGFIFVMANYFIDRNKISSSEKNLTEINQNIQKILHQMEEAKKQETKSHHSVKGEKALAK